MAKFKLDDVVDFRLGRGKVTHVWPADQLNGREQNYFVEKLDHGGTYDVNESEMTLVVEPPAETAPAEFPPPEPDQVEGQESDGDLRANPETRVAELGATGA